jgi:small subunit ribosomal protein S18
MSILPRRITATLSAQLKSGGRVHASIRDTKLSGLVSRLSLRAFSTKDGKGDNGGNSSAGDQDPFGVHFQDSAGEESGNIGPKDSLPPNYIRDSATGKFTGEIKAEASYDEKSLLNLDPTAKERMLSKRFEENIAKKDILDKDELSYTLTNVARRIREEEVSFNTLGRKVTDVMEGLEDGEEDDFASSAPLSADELESLHKFMAKTTSNDDEVTKSLMDETKGLIPTVARQSTSKTPTSGPDGDNPDLDLEWMSARAQRSMTDVDVEDLDDPFANLMPSDLNPARKVNRRRAKLIPKQLLQHNNLSLLRRYVTPGGQIMNRIQSRLGAKDQRKVAKLIKRARNLGLIPVLGQWKFEDHGNVKDPSVYEDTDWEKRLVERGLVERKSPLWNRKPEKTSSTW